MMRNDTRWRWLNGVVVILAWVCCGVARGDVGDDRILAARDAARAGDRARLVAFAAVPSQHVLEPYVQYWLLSNSLVRPDPPPVTALSGFLRREDGSYLAQRLRGDWLRRLAKDQDWADYLSLYADLDNPEAEFQCNAWLARLMQGDASGLDDARTRWLDWTNGPDGCDAVFTTLVSSGRVSDDDVWQRARRQVERKQLVAARRSLGWLSARAQPGAADIDAALESPASFVERLAPNFAADPRQRALLVLAFIRLAREDVDSAAARFSHVEQRLQADERAFVYAQLGWNGALAHDPLALSWYRAAGDIVLNAEQRAWRVRAALRAGDWAAVRWAIDGLSSEEQSQPAWVYWRGRALAQGGELDEARFQYLRIADEPSFYGMLAADELGRAFLPPRADRPLETGERARAQADPGLKRALALFRLDLRFEGVREWNWALRGKDDGFLLAAAELALRNDIYDRAINTAELADKRGNYGLRFLAPYRELIEPKALEQGLDLGWVYGLMRQESRFVPGAQSGSGARGLMQVMPDTGKYVAGKLGMRGYNVGWLSNPHTNVLLGTNYMRIILEGLDNMPVLASAGYNAGPGRARRWKDEKPLEGAVYAETIPFDETRDYVKKVMANTVVYEALFGGQPQSLKQRLGMVAARNG